MHPSPSISTDLVLAGGGHTHALVLRMLGMVRLPGVRLTLITNLVDTPYSGMLPSHISGLYDFDQSHIDLRPLTRFAGCRLIVDEVVGLNLEQRRVICAHHPAIGFDWLSIDTGSTPATVGVPGAAEHAIAAKPVPHLLHQWQQILDEVQHNPDQPLTIGVVGGGVGGVELILALQERLQRRLADLGQPADRGQFHLFHRGADLAADRNRWTRRRLQQILQERGVGLHLQESVTALTRDHPTDPVMVRCESGLTVACDRVIWVTNAAAPAWLQGTGLTLTDDGFIQVQDTLQTCSHPQIFASGDVATMINHPRPKAGVFAVRQAQPLYHNLIRGLQGQPMQPFHPQRQFLNIIDVGYGRAIASRGPFAFESRLARCWKDHIDRKFMARFTSLPTMATMAAKPILLASPSDAPPAQMLCHGCGAKVGQDALRQALRRVRQEFPDPSPSSDIVLIGLDSPDDAAVVRVPPGQVMVHTVDFFPALVDDPFIFAQIALKHGLSDLYAMGATPHSVLALVQIPNANPAKQAETLYQLLGGIQTGLAVAGAPLVGGHTTVGDSLTLGFACNGVADPARLLRKGGLQPGDSLILTQPLGTGTLFAADMQLRAKGRWIEAAIPWMLQSNRVAAEIFQAHGATACTDVTGFGLLGHLLEMVEAAGVNLVLDLTKLPVLDGARETLSQGIVSSLQPQNLQAAQALSNRQEYASHRDYPLLFDPQTAGGLLGAVPADRVMDCLQALHQAGYQAATRLGEVLPLENPTQPIKIRRW